MGNAPQARKITFLMVSRGKTSEFGFFFKLHFRAASGGSSGIDSQLSEFDIFLVDFSVRPRFLEILRARTECGRRTWFSTATTLTLIHVRSILMFRI